MARAFDRRAETRGAASIAQVCSVPGCGQRAAVRWPGEPSYRCDDHAFASVERQPTPAVPRRFCERPGCSEHAPVQVLIDPFTMESLFLCEQHDRQRFDCGEPAPARPAFRLAPTAFMLGILIGIALLVVSSLAAAPHLAHGTLTPAWVARCFGAGACLLVAVAAFLVCSVIMEGMRP